MSASTLSDKALCTRLADRYPRPRLRSYCYWKLRTDPLYPEVARVLLARDDGVTPLMDIGCGVGLFALYLKESGFRAPIHGFDYDPAKIKAASKIAAEWPGSVHFHCGDAREALPEFRGHISILDVLQYLTAEQQQSLLGEVSCAVAADGALVIRGGLRDDSWRFRVTKFSDWMAHLSFWMKSGPSNYPTVDLLEQAVAAAGLHGEVRPLWGRTPFNNYLAVFSRKA